MGRVMIPLAHTGKLLDLYVVVVWLQPLLDLWGCFLISMVEDDICNASCVIYHLLDIEFSSSS